MFEYQNIFSDGSHGNASVDASYFGNKGEQNSRGKSSAA